MMMAMPAVRWLRQRIFELTGILPLAAFRICFGLVMVLQFIQFREAFLLDYLHRSYFIRYDLFEWVWQLEASWAQYFFAVAILSSVAVMVGFAFRFFALIQCICLAFVLLQEQSMYNNHYYLLWLLSVLIMFTDAHKALGVWSMVSGKNTEATMVPRWQVLAIQLQIALVYFFGGIAKLNADWLLHAQPIKLWLPGMVPALMPYLNETMVDVAAYGISYLGVIIDLSVGFLLFTKWKRLAMVVLVLFHLSNAMMFSIGYFPLFGVLSLVIFFSDSALRAAFGRMGYKNKLLTPAIYMPKSLVLGLFMAWFAIQLLLPLRHWVFPGNVHWTMGGYYASWYMKLNDNAPLLRFEVLLPGQQQPYTFEVEKLSESPAQRHIIAAHPFTTVKFAKDIEAYLKGTANIQGDVKVYCDSYISLNGRPLQRKIDPTVDLTELELSPIGKYFTNQAWIIPLGSDTFIDAKVIYQIQKLGESNGI